MLRVNCVIADHSPPQNCMELDIMSIKTNCSGLESVLSEHTYMYKKKNLMASYMYLPGLKGLVKEIHCCPSCTKPDTSVTSLVQLEPVVVSTVSGHAPEPPRH